MPEPMLMADVEIITDGGRRRRWSAAEKLRSVEETLEDHASIPIRTNLDLNGDGDMVDAGEASNGNFNVRPALTPLPARDGLVDGTAGADVIGAGYTDGNGDKIDAGDNTGAAGGVVNSNDDVVRGFGRADSIASGDGNDTVFAGDGANTSWWCRKRCHLRFRRYGRRHGRWRSRQPDRRTGR